MPRPKPRIAARREVKITRDGHCAIVEFKDGVTPTTRLTIGESLAAMSDSEILDCYNRCVQAQLDSAASYVHVAVEIPEGRPQVEYFARGGCWTPRGDVLRCEISDNERREPVVTIDGRDFTWEEFGQMVVTWAGWGMRVICVPDDRLEEDPAIEVREPDR